MRLILALLPWLELLTLIQLGIETSALTALGYVLLTFVLGMVVIRQQGFSLFQRLREQQYTGRPIAANWLVDDMAIGFAGLLLLIPGLITDGLAIVVLIGPLRRRLLRRFGGDDGPPPPPPFGRGGSGDDSDTIEGEYRRVDDERPGVGRDR